MPRKKNYETIENVLNASWKLFCQKGYISASYADISKASGVNRATVQHYFPKKELMASMNMERLRDACEDFVSEKWPEVEDPIALQYLIGQLYVAALLSNDGVRRFTTGILENRAFTDIAIAANLEWSVEQVAGQGDATVDDEVRQDVIAGMDGLYGLMYHYAKSGDEFDIAKRLRLGLGSLGHLTGRSVEDCNKVFDFYMIEHNELKMYGADVYSMAFGGAI